MGTKTTFYKIQRARIVNLLEEGYFERKFSVKAGCSRSKFIYFGINVDKKRIDGPKLTSARDSFVIKLWFFG